MTPPATPTVTDGSRQYKCRQCHGAFMATKAAHYCSDRCREQAGEARRAKKAKHEKLFSDLQQGYITEIRELTAKILDLEAALQKLRPRACQPAVRAFLLRHPQPQLGALPAVAQAVQEAGAAVSPRPRGRLRHDGHAERVQREDGKFP